MRFCIDLLRSRADVRRRFPRALAEGPSGAFAQWLIGGEPGKRRGSARFRAAVEQAFVESPSESIRRIFAARTDLRGHFPLGLTPAGLPEFILWLLHHGTREHSLRVETIWWFALECAENPAGELLRTYLYTPEWQRAHPDGLTVFGRTELGQWLTERFDLKEPWASPANWPIDLAPAHQIRLAYASREAWRRQHPDAFATMERAQGLLRWLAGPHVGLAEDVRSWCASIFSESTARELVRGGVNILGHFCYPSGLRTSVETIAEAFARARTGLALRDVLVDLNDDEPHHARFLSLEPYEATIVHVQPQPFFAEAFERSGLHERTPRSYRIAYWYWELDSIPEEWRRSAALVDEIWVATRFIEEAFQGLDAPVYRLPPGVELPPFQPLPRSYFGIPDGTFMFLFVFHMASNMERKNPLGLIAAYRRAFGDDPTVSLILKTSFGERHPGLLKKMHAAAVGTGITIIDRVLTDAETLALMQACDSYISLHRSEGLGLTMAEAMLLGKPVIATGYSGNTDFMDSTNSLLADYRLVVLDRDVPPYRAGARWAEPSLDHAAYLMRRVRDNPEWAAALGAKAKADLTTHLSIDAAGRRMAKRLSQIAALRRAAPNTALQPL